jgi:hypothetical protein
VRSRLRAVALAALIPLAMVPTVSGCGGGSSSSTTATGAANTSTGQAEQATGPAKPQKSTSDDRSIQQFGGAANADDKSAVEGAVHSFLTAIATQDYAGICTDLAKSNREQLASFGGGNGPNGCDEALKDLLNPAVAKEAKNSAGAPITSVRVKGGTAFVLFKPPGGSESYLAMKREGGSWKSIAVTPGTPLAPNANP